MGATPHVSRWRLPACTLSETRAPSPAHLSLRYLNEFVGKLHCASDLLLHGLYPDAKEITESMALFNAVRRYLEPPNEINNVNDRPDGIIVVGDGNTPRTAAMFAYRMREWKCYSVDPAMDNQSERSKGWTDIANLVTVRNKIENVRIAVRRAIVVLVHAHVTLDQALSAVQADELWGVVTLPCCNWYGQQETLLGRQPDFVYDDFSVLSTHRELRVWVGHVHSVSCDRVDSIQTNLSLSSKIMKGCYRKEFVAIEDKGPKVTTAMDLAKGRKRHDGVLDFLHDIQSESASDAALLKYKIDHDRLRAAVASHLDTDTSVLVLDRHCRHAGVHFLLQEGYTNVYTISSADKQSWSNENEKGLRTLVFQLAKATMDEIKGETVKLRPCGHFVLQSSFDTSKQVQDEESVIVSLKNDGHPWPLLKCLFDMGAIFQGFQRRSKKNPFFFRHLYRTLDNLCSTTFSGAPKSRNCTENASLMCFTPRKQWRKNEFLAHSELRYAVHSVLVTKKQSTGPEMYMYCCYKRPRESNSARTITTLAKSNGCTIARDAALEIWREQEKMFNERQSELERRKRLTRLDFLDARGKAACDQEQADAIAWETHAKFKRVYVQVTGTVTRLRRFSTGLAFLSLELDKTGKDRPLQVFLQSDTMNLSVSTLVKLASLLRKGDQLTAIGFMDRNAHGHSMLQVEAMALTRTRKYEAFS